MFSRGAGTEAESDIAAAGSADADNSDQGAVADFDPAGAAAQDPEAGFESAGFESAGFDPAAETAQDPGADFDPDSAVEPGAGLDPEAEAVLGSGADFDSAGAAAQDPDVDFDPDSAVEPGAGLGPEAEAVLGSGADFDSAGAAVQDPEADFDPEAEQPEESFFGMQSEGMVLTGLALGPGIRRLGRVCVAVALGLGVVFWAVLVLLYGYRLIQGTQANPDMPHLPDGRPWTAYYLVGAVWAVAIGAWGLATRGSGPRLAWCFSCLVTAFFWPLGMAATVAAVAIRRPGAAMSRRLLLAGLAVLLAAGGLAWRVDAPSVHPKQTTVSSDSDLLGIWHSRSGMSVELRPDGTFAASALSGGGLRAGEPIPESSGRWESESLDGHSGVRLLVDGDLSNSLWFDLYKAGSDLVLCSTDDPGDPCEMVLRRY